MHGLQEEVAGRGEGRAFLSAVEHDRAQFVFEKFDLP